MEMTQVGSISDDFNWDGLVFFCYSHNFLSRKRLRQISVFYMVSFPISLPNQITNL